MIYILFNCRFPLSIFSYFGFDVIYNFFSTLFYRTFMFFLSRFLFFMNKHVLFIFLSLISFILYIKTQQKLIQNFGE